MDEQKLKKKLNPEQYRIMREGGTEMPYISKYWDHEEHGMYSCAACDAILFASLNKFDAETGWPTFTRPISKKSLELRPGKGEHGLTEVACTECGSHLGELMGAEEYRINSVCLNFTEAPEIDTEEKEEGSDEAQSNKTREQKPSGSSGKTFTFAIGGLVIGATIGASYAAMTCLPQESLRTPNLAPISTTTEAAPAPKTVAPKVTITGRPRTLTTPASTASPASSTPSGVGVATSSASVPSNAGAASSSSTGI